MPKFVVLLILSLAIAAGASPHGARIVGGSDAPAGKYPYQVSLWRTGRQFHCGGSIINERHVLTAAHCVYRLKPRQISVGIGSQSLSETVEFCRSEKLIAHHGFDWTTTEDDIGIVRLAEKIGYTENIKPIPLPVADFTAEDYPIALSGWGSLRAGGPQANSLQEIELKIIGQEECRTEFSVTPNQICTLTRRGEGACNGDSGGPLVVRGIQIGIVSYGRACAVGVPDVFTRVYSYLDWIATNANVE